MANEFRFALFAIKKNIQNSAELRASFLMNIVGMAINNTAFIILWLFFVKSVGTIGGWTAADIIGLNGFVALSYGLIVAFGGGIRKLPEYAASGSFDRMLLSPKNVFIRTATSAFSVSALGDIVFGFICLGIYGYLLQMTVIQMIMALALLALSSTVFLASTLAVYSTSFLFMDAHAASAGLFEFFFTPSMFHGGVFQGTMRFVFTFLIPSLLIGALPVEAVKDTSLTKFALIAILSGVWLSASLVIFKRAIKKYESSNFMSFGN